MRPSDDLSDPAQHAFAITAADSDFADGVQARGLYIGGAGDVVVITTGGDTVTFAGVQAGTILPVSVKQVRASTTAGNILGLY
jgi:hypothetical protein